MLSTLFIMFSFPDIESVWDLMLIVYVAMYEDVERLR